MEHWYYIKKLEHQPCWLRLPVSGRLGQSKNGGMKRNFPVIPIFRNFRWTSPKISTWNSGKCLLHSSTRNFQNICSSGKRPVTFVNDIFTVVVCSSGHYFHRKSSFPSRDRTLRFFTGSSQSCSELWTRTQAFSRSAQKKNTLVYKEHVVSSGLPCKVG